MENGLKNSSLNSSKSEITNYNRDQYLYALFLAERCGRYEDVLNGFETMIQKYPGIFNKNERNLFEKTIKQIIQNRQKKLNKVYNLEKEAKKKTVENENDLIMVTSLKEERGYLEADIKSICKKVLRLIDNYLMKNLNNPIDKVNINPISEKESEVFLFRLKGDLYKYLSQVEKEEDYENFLNQAKNYFKEAISIGKKTLDTYNVVNLNTIIAYSKYLQNFLKDDEAALANLNQVYKLEKTNEILEGLIQVDAESFNCLAEIKNMIIDMTHE